MTATTLRYANRVMLIVAWLAAFLRRERGAKALLICRSQRKVLALAAALCRFAQETGCRIVAEGVEESF